MNPSSKSESQRRRERKRRQQKEIERTQQELAARDAVHLDPPAIDTINSVTDTETPAASSPAALFAKTASALPPKMPMSPIAKAWQKATTDVPIKPHLA